MEHFNIAKLAAKVAAGQVGHEAAVRELIRLGHSPTEANYWIVAAKRTPAEGYGEHYYRTDGSHGDGNPPPAYARAAVATSHGTGFESPRTGLRSAKARS